MNLLNNHKKCKGVITRSRIAKEKVEKSVIDFVIVCENVISFFKNMVIDEEKINSLTNFKSKKPGKKATVSDHNSIFIDFHINAEQKGKERITKFNYRDETALKMFKSKTTNTKKLSECFTTEDSLENQTNKWIKCLKSFIQQSFQKIRINKSKKKIETKAHKLLKEREKAMKNSDGITQDILEDKILIFSFS